jgi:diketogulonate reductase-like aldo/keto reductase
MESLSVQGATIPRLGLGTARMTGRECRETVRRALGLGYRHLDTAQMYDNESAVGAGIADASVDRDEVFLTTKLDRGNRNRRAVGESTRESLARLDTEYVDLLLIHSPPASVPIAETVGAMNELQADGLVEHVGVSNFSVEQTKTAMDASETPIVTNQVEYHPGHRQDDLLAFCLDADVSLTAYSPLAVGRILDDETLTAVGERRGKSTAQVALRWLLQQQNVVAIPKAADPEHLEANLDVFEFSLTEAEMDEIFAIRGGLRERLRSLLR